MPKIQPTFQLTSLLAAAALLLLEAPAAPAFASAAPIRSECLGLPVSSALVSASSCALAGPVTSIAAGTVPGRPGDGAVALTAGQRQVRQVVPGSGPLSVAAIASGSACLGGGDGRLRLLDLNSGVLSETGACPPSAGAPQGPATSQARAESRQRAATASSSTSAPPVTASYYVYSADAAACGGSATSSCPLYQEGVYTDAPPAGGLVVLDFGAPCYVSGSNPLVYGTQLFGTKTCTPAGSLRQPVLSFLAGYESTHGAGTPPLTVAIGTSNSLSGALPAPAYSMTPAQMQSHGGAWYGQLVGPLLAATAGLAAPATVWGASDIEEAGDGNWYDPTTTIPWVQAFTAAAGGRRGCAPGTPGFMLDYGDNPIGGGPSTVGGWTAAQVYQVAWGIAGTCAMPEIYYDGLAQEWQALNQWAVSHGQTPIQFTGVMAEPGSPPLLSPPAAWGQLQSLSAQSPPIQFLTTINSALVAPAPAVSSISPSAGPPGGGTLVVVTGSDFISVSGVSFGGTPASSFTVTSPTQLTAFSPPLATGVVDVVVTAAAGSSAAVPADRFTAGAAGGYHALVPARILDTRAGSGYQSAGQRLASGGSLTVQVAGQGGVPASGATAAILNLTATGPDHDGYLTAYPAGGSRPLASNLNFAAGQTVANLVEVALGQDGQVTVYSGPGAVDVVADVQGWVGPSAGGAGLYNPLPPARVADTRTGSGYPGAGQAPVAGATVELQVTGQGGVPATGVSAVLLNLTAVGPSSAGYLTAYPTATPRPLASNLNFAAGQNVPNLVAVPVGAGGRVSVYNPFGQTDVVADVEGWLSDGSAATAPGSTYNPLPPARILDTRPGSGLPGAGRTAGPGATLPFQVAGLGGVPAGARAAVLNVTAVNPTAPGFLTVYPSGGSRPNASNLNFTAGQVTANLVVVPLGSSGDLDVYNLAGSTDVVVDVAGWYS